MANMQIPGIYVSPQEYRLNPLQIDKRCVAGFVGIAERGPLHTPVTVSSFDEYIKTFGLFDTAGNLPFSVYSFFKCGGAECVIVRVANEKCAKQAQLQIKCSGGGKVLFEASSKGSWGNYISAHVWHESDEIAKASEVDATDGNWIASDEEDIAVNDVLQISLMGQKVIRDVIKKDGNKLFFDKPLKLLGKIENPAQNIKLEKAYVSVSLSCKDSHENFLHLSMNPSSERYFVSYINGRSRLCTVRANDVHGIIKPVYSALASDGRDGIAEMTAGDFIGHYNGPNQFRGLGALESRDDISLISVPDAAWLYSQSGASDAEREKAVFAVHGAMVTQAERFPGRFAVLDVPNGLDGIKILSWAKRFDSSCAAAYFPHIDIVDPMDSTGAKTVRIPPSGAICGSIAVTDSEKGIFHAPANTLLNGAVALANRIEDSEYEMLYPAGVNLLKYFPGRGIKIWGARTLSSDPNWRYINVRRTFSSICRSLKIGTQWAVFEPNDKKLWKRVVRQVSGFLLDLWMQGYLAGSTAEQGFYVRCDEELNPPENVDQGILTFSVGLAITKPTEFFQIAITAEKDGASVYIKED
ncbi:MAG: phage tail sheath subtilisin-like domain-containing protein [Treponema sp.]|jgi:phage tail sheath protein FI|nr:phage tail sheath subtilisin-like domain-containing protein [Treponema sp.]